MAMFVQRNIMLKFKTKATFVAIFLSVTVGVYANAPIVSGGGSSAISGQNLTARVARVENQLRYLVNLDGKVAGLNAKLDALRGQVEIVQFGLAKVTQQQKLEQAQITKLSAKFSSLSSGAKKSKNTAKSVALDKQYYAKAYQLLKKKQYRLATKQFKMLLSRYPKSDYRYSSNYWLGELSLINGDAKSAKRYYNKVLSNRSSYRAKDAILKLANIYVVEGNKVKAKKLFNEVINRFKGTTAAKKAKGALNSLKT